MFLITSLIRYYNLIGLIIFISILSKIDLTQLKQILITVNLKYFLIAAFLSIPLLLSKAWCWQYLLRSQKISYSLKDCFLMYGKGIYFNFWTPGKLGDFIKVFYQKKDGFSTAKSFSSILIDRGLDILTIGLFGYFGLIYFQKFFQREIIPVALTLLLLLICLIISLRHKKMIKTVLKYLLSLLIPLKYRQKLNTALDDLINAFNNYSKKDFLVAFFITLFSWLIYFGQMQILAASLNIKLSFIFIIFSVSLAGLITLLPISIAGLGTRDLTLIYLFSFFSISKEMAILFAFSIFLMTVTITIIGLICHFLKPLDLEVLK